MLRYDQQVALIVSVMRSAIPRRRPGKRALPGLTAVILAAGASRRYGEPKQLVRYRGETLLERSVRLTRTAGARQVCVVLGYRGDVIQRALERNGVYLDCGSTVRNPRWRDGMGRSLACGIRASTPECEGGSGLLERSAEAGSRGPGEAGFGLAARSARCGSVPLCRQAGCAGDFFPRSWFGILKSLTEDRGAQVLLASESSIVGVPMPNAGVDIDRREDLAQLPP